MIIGPTANDDDRYIWMHRMGLIETLRDQIGDYGIKKLRNEIKFHVWVKNASQNIGPINAIIASKGTGHSIFNTINKDA